jgi:tetratricopeptide (TPR) repeat protein
MTNDRLQRLEKLLALDPADPFVLYGLAQEHAKLEHVAQACELYDRCLQIDATYCYAYYHKAKLLSEHEQVEQAVSTIQAGMSAARACRDTKALSELQGLLDSIT